MPGGDRPGHLLRPCAAAGPDRLGCLPGIARRRHSESGPGPCKLEVGRVQAPRRVIGMFGRTQDTGTGPIPGPGPPSRRREGHSAESPSPRLSPAAADCAAAAGLDWCVAILPPVAPLLRRQPTSVARRPGASTSLHSEEQNAIAPKLRQIPHLDKVPNAPTSRLLRRQPTPVARRRPAAITKPDISPEIPDFSRVDFSRIFLG